MVNIVSDNKKAEKALKKIVKILEKNGADIDADLEVRCLDGNVSVHSLDNREMRRIFKIPHTMLVPYDQFEIGIKKDKFVIKSMDEKLSEPRRALLKCMIDIYNATDKLRQHRETSPWIRYKDDPDVMDVFLNCRYGDEFSAMSAMLAEGEDDAFTLTTFFKTRLLACRIHKEWGRKVSVLLPLVDAMNHHVLGAGFDHIYTRENAALSIHSKMMKSSDECFACYGRMDTLDTFLHYGFADPNAVFVRSVPLIVTLEGLGEIRIQSSYGRVAVDDMPEKLKDLVFFMPAVSINEEERAVQLTHLFIPGPNGLLSMRRILGYAVRLLAPEMENPEVAAHVLEVEKAVINMNANLYSRLRTAANGLSEPEKTQEICALIDMQNEKMQRYIDAMQDFYARKAAESPS